MEAVALGRDAQIPLFGKGEAVGHDPFARLEDAARMVGRSAAIDPANPPRLPGARAIAALRRTQKWGLDLPAPLLVDLKERAGV